MRRYSLLLIMLLVLLVPFAVFAYISPGRQQGYVNDFANVLSAQDRQTLESQLYNLDQKTGVQAAIVTIQALGDETIDTYAVKLFQEWGIGNKNKDNGLLILAAINDRKARIEVGYGLEGTVTDLQSGNIISQVITPAFRAGNYGAGLKGAVDAVVAIVTNSGDASIYSTPNNNGRSSGQGIDPFIFFFLFIIVVNVFGRILGKTKSWWLGGVLGAIAGAIIGLIWGLSVGIFAIIFLTVIGLLFDYIVSKHPPGSGSRGGGIWPIFFGGGRGGFGGSGGGFGGFGGGSSGGGGASGSW